MGYNTLVSKELLMNKPRAKSYIPAFKENAFGPPSCSSLSSNRENCYEIEKKITQ